MSDKKTVALDPMRAWRDWFVGAEKEWSDSLTRLMKDETVAKTMGQDFGAALHRHQMFAEVIGKALSALNLPSREEVLALGERLGRIEDTLAAVQASLTHLSRAGGAGAGAGTVAAGGRPPRTRQALVAPTAAVAAPAKPAKSTRAR